MWTKDSDPPHGYSLGGNWGDIKGTGQESEQSQGKDASFVAGTISAGTVEG